MLGFGLNLAHRHHGTWWPSNAVYAADFVNNRYMRNGTEIDRASAFSFSRSTPRLAEDSRGAWHQFGVDAPAITDQGLSLEPAATNFVGNPLMTGALPGIIGAGGALPTGWSTTNFAPVEVLDTGWEDGLPFITVRLHYTNSSSSTQYPCLIPLSGAPANLGEQWTGSSFYKLLEGAWHSNNAAFLNVQEAGTTLIYPNVARSGGMTARTRMALTWTTTRAGAIALQLRAVMFNIAPGDSVDCVIRVYAPTLMKEAAASSPVVAPGLVRAADSLTIALPAGASQLVVSPLSGPEIALAANAGLNAIPSAAPMTVRRIIALP